METPAEPVTEAPSTDMGAARGRLARRPWQVPWSGWKDVLWRVRLEVENDNVFDLAASVAFYGLLALFPALIATVSSYGLLADPGDIVRQVNGFSFAMPWTARSLILDQLNELKGSSPTLRVGVIVGVVVAIFSASGGVAALMRGINASYDEKETRGYIRFRLLALAFTVGFALFVIVSVALITLLPVVFEYIGLPQDLQDALRFFRWPALGIATMAGLAILYRYAPNRTPARWQWVTPGSILATLIWILASLSFSAYAENFGSYNKTYGTLGGAVVLALWMYLSALAILLGAELNSELEHQTRVDSTIGPPRPMGERGATMADTLGELRPASTGPSSLRQVLRSALHDLNRGRRKKQSPRAE